MKDDLKDILSIPSHILNYEKTSEKDEKNKIKEENKKSNIASKDIMNVTKGLFPLKVARPLTGPKKSFAK